MKDTYRCAICGRSNVKLWRPYLDTKPIICTKCAEERLIYKKYNRIHTDQIFINLEDLEDGIDPEYAGGTTMIPVNNE